MDRISGATARERLSLGAREDVDVDEICVSEATFPPQNHVEFSIFDILKFKNGRVESQSHADVAMFADTALTVSDANVWHLQSIWAAYVR